MRFTLQLIRLLIKKDSMMVIDSVKLMGKRKVGVRNDL